MPWREGMPVRLELIDPSQTRILLEYLQALVFRLNESFPERSVAAESNLPCTKPITCLWEEEGKYAVLTRARISTSFLGGE